jgi:hypothetical protein
VGYGLRRYKANQVNAVKQNEMLGNSFFSQIISHDLVHASLGALYACRVSFQLYLESLCVA